MVLTKIITKIVGDPYEKELKKIRTLVQAINAKEEEYQNSLSAADIPKKTEEFKQRIQNGETVDDLLLEAFALVKFACRSAVGKKWDVRGNEIEWNMIPYDVQILGGVVLHRGNIAEMKTGEGKTLVSTFPIYLNALTGKGVHVVTVNNYLAHRDSEWMGGLFNLLGLNVGYIYTQQSLDEKKAAYDADITYGTNNEFGFDYLRDNMARDKKERVQRPPHYAIIDEVDSILIDEARTPLIISAPAEESADQYQQYSQLVQKLQEEAHYTVDEKTKTALITEDGISQMEQLLGVDNIYTEKGFSEVHHIEQALKAKTVYQKDTDYVIQDGQVVIVDEFTGRLMPGRRYGQGLHQAIEAKEGLAIKRESRTLATITFQNYFRLYKKLAGMTGTAKTEAEEFGTIYGLDTFVIPTNKPIARKDLADVVFKNIPGKFAAIAAKTKELHEKGQPVLIGTVSVEKSEMLSQLLKDHNVPHNVLNAKQHEKEAEIVANAGQKGAVTIATNMAGRGTDIKLGDGVLELGGLYVIGTERHESRRIDNQLRGRSGRQGDPGTSQFYLCMEDELMRLFGGDNLIAVMERLKVPEDMPIENRIITRSVESAQRKVEGRNFDIRKHLVQYDDVMNRHREIMYKRRNEILDHEDVRELILEMLDQEATEIVMTNSRPETKEKWDYKTIANLLSALHKDSSDTISEAQLATHKESETLVKVAQDFLRTEYAAKETEIGDAEIMRRIERAISLKLIDLLWMRHIDDMTKLREKVSLKGYGQRDPLIEYKNEAFHEFTKLTREIHQQIVNGLFRVKVQRAEEQAKMEDVKPTSTSSAQFVTAQGPVQAQTTNSTSNTKVGRNDPCPCGSKKKYKKCCGANQ